MALRQQRQRPQPQQDSQVQVALLISMQPIHIILMQQQLLQPHNYTGNHCIIHFIRLISLTILHHGGQQLQLQEQLFTIHTIIIRWLLLLLPVLQQRNKLRAQQLFHSRLIILQLQQVHHISQRP
jgi:hypothetical protein